MPGIPAYTQLQANTTPRLKLTHNLQKNSLLIR